jgi:hypothetical protein
MAAAPRPPTVGQKEGVVKKLPFVVLLAALIAVPAWGAVRQEHHFSLTFSSKAPRSPSGVTFSTDRFNYKAPSPGQAADRVGSVTFQLAPGTRIDTKAFPSCAKSALAAMGPGACPRGSRVGSGQAVIITGLPIDPVKMSAKVFTTKAGLLTYLTGSGQTQVLALSVSGSKIVAPVPHVCPTGDCSQVEAVLKKLTVTLKPGKLVTTPAKCPATRKWVNKALYKYVNGDTETEKSTSACRR